MRKLLLRGTLLGGLGAALLLLTGTLLSTPLLSLFGLPVLIVSSLLIGLGLFPYRKLSRLEMRPHELSTDGKTLFFAKSARPLFKIPTSCIEKIEYLEKEGLYGIALFLDKNSSEKVVVQQRSFALEAFIQDAKIRFHCDLFFPYFTERASKELLETLYFSK